MDRLKNIIRRDGQDRKMLNRRAIGSNCLREQLDLELFNVLNAIRNTPDTHTHTHHLLHVGLLEISI